MNEVAAPFAGSVRERFFAPLAYRAREVQASGIGFNEVVRDTLTGIPHGVAVETGEAHGWFLHMDSYGFRWQ